MIYDIWFWLWIKMKYYNAKRKSVVVVYMHSKPVYVGEHVGHNRKG